MKSRSALAIVLLGLVVFLPRSGDRISAQSTANIAQDDLSLWLAAAREHQTGRADDSAIQIARWSTSELEAIVALAKTHVRSFDKARRDEANRVLLRGAVLHADIAKFVPDHMIAAAVLDHVIVVGDGGQTGTSYPTIHWAIGRRLLDGVAPAPATEPEVLTWYRRSAAYLLSTHALSEALPHLERARQIFPADPEILLDSAYLHEKFASPMIQAATVSIDRSRGIRLGVDVKRIELERAQRFLHQALVMTPKNAEARVRLGHIIGELGRHKEAAAELRHAIRDGLDGQFLYFAELFLGREEEALGNRMAAKASYERASTMYPNAQSPRLALSQLARQAGDREGALRALQPIADLPRYERLRQDPWWTYYDVR